MDPLSQGALGAIVAQSAARRNQLGIATAFGLLSGMAADLDVFISSSTDPLLFLEYHRQFTHSLVFIPIGGLLCALFLFLVSAKGIDKWFRRVETIYQFLWRIPGTKTARTTSLQWE